MGRTFDPAILLNNPYAASGSRLGVLCDSRHSDRRRRAGLVLQRAAVLASIFAALCFTPIAVLRAQTSPWQRPFVRSRVAAHPGKHLILVTYQQGHTPDYEWVYNSTDLDSSRVMWHANWTQPVTASCSNTFANGRFGSPQ
jgi:hypothetical protein